MTTDGVMEPAAFSGLAPLAAEAADGPPQSVSLYVHVPFCVSKCAYCDFYSQPGGVGWHARYVDAALFEAGHWSHFDLLDDVVSLYIGGGTPTALGAEVVRLVRGLRDTVTMRHDAEVTLETNPETTDAALVAELMRAGVNRFSLGVQSFDDAVLRTLGRCHDAARAHEACSILRSAGTSFSIDLMCGVPGQSNESWERTLQYAVSCGARHVSVYPLTVEPGTPMALAVASAELPEPDPDVAADMMLAAEAALAAVGMPRYEVANYAQPGCEARHNTVYWAGGAYIGLGPSASSMLPYAEFACVAEAEGWPLTGSKDAARTRFTRASDLAGYVQAPLGAPAEIEQLSAAEAAREDVMLGLRLTVGVTAAQVTAAGLTPVLERLLSDGLVELVRTRWRTTQRGWLLGNEVFSSVWAGE